MSGTYAEFVETEVLPSNSSRPRSGFRYCDQGCISLTRSCKLSPRCEATSDERSAGNLHATFCGSRGAGDRPRPPGGDQRRSSLPRPQNHSMSAMAMLSQLMQSAKPTDFSCGTYAFHASATNRQK